MFIRHSIDIFNNRYITGWIFHRLKKNSPLTLYFTSGGTLIGNVVANSYRKDLQVNSIHPTGFCGFNFNFPEDTNLTLHDTLDIRFNSATGKILTKIQTSSIKPPKKIDLPKVFFMHIPKTAGTSFNSFIRLHLPNEKLKIHLESLPDSEYPELKEKCVYLAGHLTLEKFKAKFSVEEFELFTIVRNPDKHLHSHLNWLKGVGAHPETDFFKQHNPTVQNLARKVASLNFDNLLMVEEFVMGLENYECDFFDNCQTRYFLDYRPSKVSKNDLNNAVENLKLFKSIGRTERYSDFTSHFSGIFALDKISETSQSKSFNKAIEPPLYDVEDTALAKKLLPLIQFDNQIYHEIKKTHG